MKALFARRLQNRIKWYELVLKMHIMQLEFDPSQTEQVAAHVANMRGGLNVWIEDKIEEWNFCVEYAIANS